MQTEAMLDTASVRVRASVLRSMPWTPKGAHVILISMTPRFITRIMFMFLPGWSSSRDPVLGWVEQACEVSPSPPTPYRLHARHQCGSDNGSDHHRKELRGFWFQGMLMVFRMKIMPTNRWRMSHIVQPSRKFIKGDKSEIRKSKFHWVTSVSIRGKLRTG